ncbi:MAG: folate-binding protein, partial [Hydrocarboniphaga effusa]|nr:folate-binding protein [Hydrocarboniphaga effusa]
MLAVVHLLRARDSVLIELHESIAEAVLKRLRLFVLRSKVSLENASAAVASIGLLGDGAAAALAGAGLPVPLQPLDCACDAQRDLTVVRRIGEMPRYSITGPVSAIAALRAAWPAPLGYTAWRRADIEAGVPVVYPQTSDHFVPQMANLDRLGGI